MKIFPYLLIILYLSDLYSTEYTLTPNELTIVSDVNNPKYSFLNTDSNAPYTFKGIVDVDSINQLKKPILHFKNTNIKDLKSFTISTERTQKDCIISLQFEGNCLSNIASAKYLINCLAKSLIDYLIAKQFLPSDIMLTETSLNDYDQSSNCGTINATLQLSQKLLGFPYKDVTLFSQELSYYASGRVSSKATKSVLYQHDSVILTFQENNYYIRSFHSTIINNRRYFFLEYINGTLDDEGERYTDNLIPDHHYISILMLINNNEAKAMQNIELPLNKEFNIDDYRKSYYYNKKTDFFYYIPAFENARFSVCCIFKNYLILFDKLNNAYYAFELNEHASIIENTVVDKITTNTVLDNQNQSKLDSENITQTPTEQNSSVAIILSKIGKNLFGICVKHKLPLLLSTTIFLLYVIIYKKNYCF